jgi:hypothetical protein
MSRLLRKRMPSCLYFGGCQAGPLLLLLLLSLLELALAPDLLLWLLLLLLCVPLLPASLLAANCSWPTSLTPGGGLPL